MGLAVRCYLSSGPPEKREEPISPSDDVYKSRPGALPKPIHQQSSQSTILKRPTVPTQPFLSFQSFLQTMDSKSVPPIKSSATEAPFGHQRHTHRDSGFSTLSAPHTLPQDETPLVDPQRAQSKPSLPKQAPVYSSPAPTTSDIHNPAHEHDEPDSEGDERVIRQSFASPMLERFLRIDPDNSSLKHEDNFAINQGRVQLGENMLERRWREMEENKVMAEKKDATAE
ncbi:hypothetical protein FN846DRAFT_962437 [Sphaerosporella brunnea]|uniref:Uncharacterized protein n=1 Tax=Sphaerosporella brunnea TaxID=1250544 RepID=A0A5J5EP97_9PEZI|nr:hypothetical protein FN846DRAFT_962428 [Sphaerosporella brunnea]KAA8898459.1 hypothetical protein FN846DRAFT_962437 [Sphaerosporella brunnea]